MIKYSPISQAADWAARGFSPIPIRPYSKVPGFGRKNMLEWTDFCLRQATSEEVRRWILLDPRAGLGIACGFNGVIGVDVDDPEAIPVAREVFGQFKAPSKIGRKGATAFFRDPTGKIASRKYLKRKQPDGKRPTLVEVLGIGNQTVLPPTIHPGTGVPYRWHNQPLSELSASDLPVIDDFMLMELKDRLAPLMEQERENIVPSRQVRAVNLTDQIRRRYQGFASKALDAEVSRLALQPKPGRNRELFRAVCNLGKFAANGILPSKIIADRLLEACDRNRLKADNGVHDVMKTIQAGFNYARNDPLPGLQERRRKHPSGRRQSWAYANSQKPQNRSSSASAASTICRRIAGPDAVREPEAENPAGHRR